MSVAEENTPMSPIAEEAVQSIEVFKILSSSLSVLFKNFVPFVGLVLIITLPVFLLEAYLGITPSDDDYEISGIMGLVYFVLSLVLNQIAVGTLVYGSFLSLNGEKVSMGRTVSRGFSRVLPVIAVALLAGILYMIGTLFLIIPGIIIYMALFVAVPVTVVERIGVIDSLRRSRELTKGNRWRIFALNLLFFVVLIVFMAVAVPILLTLGNTDIAPYINHFFNTILAAFIAVVTGVTYHSLRVANEGVDAKQLASVFD